MTVTIIVVQSISASLAILLQQVMPRFPAAYRLFSQSGAFTMLESGCRSAPRRNASTLCLLANNLFTCSP